jgi:hypothetical protein
MNQEGDINFLVGTPWSRPRCRWKDDIKRDIRTVCEVVNWKIWLNDGLV